MADNGRQLVSEAASVHAAALPPVRAGRSGAGDPLFEKPVFVSDDGRRRRALRLAASGAVAVGAVWLVALIAGAFGLGRLSGVPLPPIGALSEPSGGVAQEGISKAHRAAGRRASDAAKGIDHPSLAYAPAGPARGGKPTGEPGFVPPREPVQVLPGSTPSSVRSPSATAAPTAPTTATPRRNGHAPSETPSGNTVPAATKDAGPAQQSPLEPPGLSTRPKSGY
jgi:hypothetical protein